tara:strand:+ start:223 stop:567 length:345 start_codon:yes stop_codon:yes gene_type:complete
MNTVYKISRMLFGQLKSVVVRLEELTIDVLKDSATFSISAFTELSKSERDLVIAQMTALRDGLGWKSEVTCKEFDSETYGKGYAITVMKEAIKPKASFDDMQNLIASLEGNSSA